MRTLSRLAVSLFDGAIATRASAREAETTTETENLYVFHDTIYHQCQIVLHSLMVPLFCGATSDRGTDCDLQTRMEAAQTVLNHADASDKLLSPFLRGGEDISRLPPLLGYSAFVVGTVFLSVELAQRNQAASELPAATGNRRAGAVESIVRLLDILSGYWTMLKEPVSSLKLQRLYMHETNEECSETSFVRLRRHIFRHTENRLNRVDLEQVCCFTTHGTLRVH